MTCQNVQARLSAYQDGELDRQWHERITAHLGECTACKAEWQALQGLERQLKAAAELEPSNRFVSSVMTRLPGLPSRKKRLVPSLVYGLAFLFVFAIGFLISLSQQNHYPKIQTAAKEYMLNATLLEGQNMQLLAVQDQTMRFLEENPRE